jgi:hypothetical protein
LCFSHFSHDLCTQLCFEVVHIDRAKGFSFRRFRRDLISLFPRMPCGESFLSKRRVGLRHCQELVLHLVEVIVVLRCKHFGRVEARVECGLLRDLGAEMILPALLVLKYGRRRGRWIAKLLEFLFECLCAGFGFLPSPALRDDRGMV